MNAWVCYYFLPRMINVQVEKSNNENALTLLRRFNKRVQGAGLIGKVRGQRYKERNQSRYTKKKKTLKRIERRNSVLELVKQGKLPDKTTRF